MDFYEDGSDIEGLVEGEETALHGGERLEEPDQPGDPEEKEEDPGQHRHQEAGEEESEPEEQEQEDEYDLQGYQDHGKVPLPLP